MVERFLKIFIDDFSIYGDSFHQCFYNLELVLIWWTEKNLTYIEKNYHFIVQHEIVLGHEIFMKGIEVDKAKVDIIAKLFIPKCVKDIQSFLEHDGFYHRFIKDFSKISRPLTNLLAEDVLSLGKISRRNLSLYP